MSKCIICSQMLVFTHPETSTPIVCSVIDDGFLKLMPAIPWCRSIQVINFPETDPLLYFCEHFEVHWVQIQVLEPHDWWNKRGCLSCQKSEVADTDMEAMQTHCVDTLIKSTQQISHMTGRWCWVRNMLW